MAAQDSPWAWRRRLPHDSPRWVRHDGCYIITVCTTPRGVNQVANEQTAPWLWETVRHRQARGLWRLDAMVVMPDHVHVLVLVPVNTDLRKTVTDWKRYVARQQGVRWQRDFFDYRLRATDSIARKRDYLRLNPQAAGLVSDASDWPWFWSHE